MAKTKIPANDFFSDMDAANEYYRRDLRDNPPVTAELTWKRKECELRLRLTGAKIAKTPTGEPAGVYLARRLEEALLDLAAYNVRTVLLDKETGAKKDFGAA